jgi:hydrogenase accessory protein HypB
MVADHLYDWENFDLLLVENVGNLVCSASYDLGEAAKVVVLSVMEGEGKPLKYPGIFRRAELMVINKIDLLRHVPFRMDLARENAQARLRHWRWLMLSPGFDVSTAGQRRSITRRQLAKYCTAL